MVCADKQEMREMVDYDLMNEIHDNDEREIMEAVQAENNDAAAEAEYMQQVLDDWCNIEL